MKANRRNVDFMLSNKKNCKASVCLYLILYKWNQNSCVIPQKLIERKLHFNLKFNYTEKSTFWGLLLTFLSQEFLDPSGPHSMPFVTPERWSLPADSQFDFRLGFHFVLTQDRNYGAVSYLVHMGERISNNRATNLPSLPATTAVTYFKKLFPWHTTLLDGAVFLDTRIQTSVRFRSLCNVQFKFVRMWNEERKLGCAFRIEEWNVVRWCNEVAWKSEMCGFGGGAFIFKS